MLAFIRFVIWNIQETIYDIKNFIFRKFPSIYVWVYNRDNKKANKLKAYYKKIGKNPDADD